MVKPKLANERAAFYFKDVCHELADVPWRERNELLSSLSERLAELPANTRPEHQLGPAREYASELRESAGLPPQRRNPFARFRATRLRTKLTIFGCVLLTVAVVGAAVARQHYQPVTTETDFGAGTAQQIEDNLVTDVNYVRYEPGKLIVRGMVVRNHGWATVTVDGFDVSTLPAVVSLREMRATTDEQLTGQWTLIPKVAHVTIPPGKTAYLFMVLKIRPFPIGPPGGGTTFSQPNLKIRVLGVHHEVVEPANQIGVLSR